MALAGFDEGVRFVGYESAIESFGDWENDSLDSTNRADI